MRLFQNTPLYIASLSGHLSVVEALIKGGSKVNEGYNEGVNSCLQTIKFLCHSFSISSNF